MALSGVSPAANAAYAASTAGTTAATPATMTPEQRAAKQRADIQAALNQYASMKAADPAKYAAAEATVQAQTNAAKAAGNYWQDNPTTQKTVAMFNNAATLGESQNTRAPLQNAGTQYQNVTGMVDAYGNPIASKAVEKTGLTPEQQAFYDALPQYYSGSTVAARTPDQIAAANMIKQQAAANQTRYDTFLNDFLDDQTGTQGNPFMQDVMDSATRQITDNFTQQVLPQLGSAAQRSGAWGGSRQGIVESLAAGQTAQAVGDTAARLAAENYQTTLQNNLQRAQLTPALFDASYRPAQLLDAVGQDAFNYNQAVLDADVARHDYLQNADAQRLAQISAMLSGGSTTGIMAGGSQTQTSTTNRPKSSNLQNALGGAAAGAALGSMTGIENAGGWGAVLGALGGLLG